MSYLTEARLNEILTERGLALSQDIAQLVAKHTADVSNALTREEGDNPSE